MLICSGSNEEKCKMLVGTLVEARTTFGERDEAKTIRIRYMVVNTHSSYNILLGRPIINKLGAVVSSVHMRMKYPTDRGTMGTIKVDQRTA